MKVIFPGVSFTSNLQDNSFLLSPVELIRSATEFSSAAPELSVVGGSTSDTVSAYSEHHVILNKSKGQAVDARLSLRDASSGCLHIFEIQDKAVARLFTTAARDDQLTAAAARCSDTDTIAVPVLMSRFSTIASDHPVSSPHDKYGVLDVMA